METKVIREERYQTNKLIGVLEDLEELSNHLGSEFDDKEKQKMNLSKYLLTYIRDEYDKMLNELDKERPT